MRQVDNKVVTDQNYQLLLDETRRRLVETGTRNRLIHVNRKASRGNFLNIVNEKSDEIFDILYRKLKKMKFIALGKETDSDEASDAPSLSDLSHNDEFDTSRYTDNNLETLLNKDALQKRLLRIQGEAKTAEQEQGVNILFLALGFLNWLEDKKSAVERSAPLILLPVVLERNPKTATFDISIRDDELIANLPLQERLLEDFGIKLPEVDVEDTWQPSKYFDALQEQINEREKWSIDRDAIQLGCFSFAKLLMYRDLDPKNWSNGSLSGNKLVSGLLREGFDSAVPLFGSSEKLDEKLTPSDIIQVVDADASQTKVIEEVRSGRDLVVQGPPGTGKSQTITNIIASAVHDGKSVLFMAEKMAALTVVKEKLEKNGLGHIALELHSRQANKKAVLSSIKQTLAASLKARSGHENTKSLHETRDKLNQFSSILHKEIPRTDETPFSVMGIQSRLVGSGAQPPKLRSSALEAMPQEDLKKTIEYINNYSELKAKVGGLESTSLSMVSNLDMQPTDLERAVRQVPDIVTKISDLEGYILSALSALGAKLPINLVTAKSLADTLSKLTLSPEINLEHKEWLRNTKISGRLKDALSVAVDYIKLLKAADSHFVEDCWELKLSHHRMSFVNGVRSFWSRLGPKYRSASNELASILKEELPKTAPERLEFLDRFLAVQSAKKKFELEADFLKGQLGDDWRAERTEFSEFSDLVLWWLDAESKLKSYDKDILINSYSNGFDPRALAKSIQLAQHEFVQSYEILNELVGSSSKGESINGHKPIELEVNLISEISGRLEALKETLVANYEDWRQMKRYLIEFEKSDLVPLLKSIDEGVGPEVVVQELEYARAEHIWKSVFGSEIDRIAQQDRHRLVKHYQTLEKSRIEDTKKQIMTGFYNKVPQGAAGGMGVIQSEIGKKSRHKAIRKLMSEAGETIQKIKPVFLMSPISIAQFLPPEKLMFDLLVIDEASQVRPEDALGAIARSRQIVVVGDQKQMPPSSFFDRLTSNEVEDGDDLGLDGKAQAIEMESILTLCQARGLGGQPRMLEWHYRSKDPSLIAVSNRNFYDNNLILPPTPLQSDERFGLRYTYVEGVYARGQSSKNINTIEAQAVVDRVKEHAREYPMLSLGIATFSKVQQNHLNELLEHARRDDEVLDLFLREGKHEDVFIKNLENIQGDERDVILVSVCYGPAEPGGRLLSMSFGPVNSEGGERRLNVLFTRARYRTEVFCSFDPRDIDISKTSNIGPKILQEYLLYAKDGQLPDIVETGLAADSDFEIDVANEIRRLGYEVEHQVGSQGFRIDLAVRDKNWSSQFILAVECDGATYHSALWARERDRLRQGILEQHGWSFHRIWSTDWFYKRHNEIERLKLALETASLASNQQGVMTGANADISVDVSANIAETKEEASLEDVEAIFAHPTADPYVFYQHTHITTDTEPHLYPFSKAKALIGKIVEAEGPVHESEVARRYAGCFGKSKAGKRIVEFVNKGLVSLKRDSNSDIISDQGFYLTRERALNMWVRDRSGLSGGLLKASMHSRLEIAAAAKDIEQRSGPVEDEELSREIAIYMGYKRTGPDLKKVLVSAIEYYRRPSL